jgi:histidinol dehydrogenase
MRILLGQSAARMVQRLASRGTSLTALEPRVRTIITNVRDGGDRALRRYAERWDGLAKDHGRRCHLAIASHCVQQPTTSVALASGRNHVPGPEHNAGSRSVNSLSRSIPSAVMCPVDGTR